MEHKIKPLVVALYTIPARARALGFWRPALTECQLYSHSAIKDINEWEWLWMNVRIAARLSFSGA